MKKILLVITFSACLPALSLFAADEGQVNDGYYPANTTYAKPPCGSMTAENPTGAGACIKTVKKDQKCKSAPSGTCDTSHPQITETIGSCEKNASKADFKVKGTGYGCEASAGASCDSTGYKCDWPGIFS